MLTPLRKTPLERKQSFSQDKQLEVKKREHERAETKTPPRGTQSCKRLRTTLYFSGQFILR